MLCTSLPPSRVTSTVKVSPTWTVEDEGWIRIMGRTCPAAGRRESSFFGLEESLAPRGWGRGVGSEVDLSGEFGKATVNPSGPETISPSWRDRGSGTGSISGACTGGGAGGDGRTISDSGPGEGGGSGRPEASGLPGKRNEEGECRLGGSPVIPASGEAGNGRLPMIGWYSAAGGTGSGPFPPSLPSCRNRTSGSSPHRFVRMVRFHLMGSIPPEGRPR